MTAQPLIGSFAQALYDRMEPYTNLDEQNGWALAYYFGAFGAMVQDIEDIARDSELGPGWSAIMDLSRAPDYGLPWLGQFVGVRFDAAVTPAEQRLRISDTPGWRRGSVPSLVGAMQQYLTGPKRVLLHERAGSAYHFNVVTYTAETPDAAMVELGLLSQKPAGLTYTYSVYDGQDYQQLLDENPTYQDVFTNFATYDLVATHNI